MSLGPDLMPPILLTTGRDERTGGELGGWFTEGRGNTLEWVPWCALLPQESLSLWNKQGEGQKVAILKSTRIGASCCNLAAETPPERGRADARRTGGSENNKAPHHCSLQVTFYTHSALLDGLPETISSWSLAHSPSLSPFCAPDLIPDPICLCCCVQV